MNHVFLVSITHLILRFAIVQNKFQQTNKTKINPIKNNHIKFEVSLHFWGIWPIVRKASSTRKIKIFFRDDTNKLLVKTKEHENEMRLK